MRFKTTSLLIWVVLLALLQHKGVLKQILTNDFPAKSASSSPFFASPVSIRRLLNNDTLECDPNLHENPPDDRCDCARQLSGTTIISYGVFHYCDMVDVPSLSLFLLIIAALLWFFFLAKTTDDYLVPAVEKYSQFLRLPPSVAGVTLLAFGNGAADVLASYASFVSGNAAIGVGAILGAGIFVITVVLGLVIITAGDFQAHKRDFVRDAIFYFCSILWLEKVFDDGEVYLEEAIVFVSIYLLYVLTVVFSNRLENLIRKVIGRPATTNNQDLDIGLLKDEASSQSDDSSTQHLPASPSYGSTNNTRGNGPPPELLSPVAGDKPPTPSPLVRQGSDKWDSSLVAQYYLHHFHHKERAEYEQEETQFIDMPESAAPSTSTLTSIKNFTILWLKRFLAIIEIPIVELAMRLTIPRLGDPHAKEDEDNSAGASAPEEQNEDLLAQRKDSDGEEAQEKKYMKNILTKPGEHFVIPGDLMTKASRDTDDLVNPRELSFALLFSPLLICFVGDLKLRAYIISFLIGSLLAAWLHDQLYKMPVVNRSVIGGLLVLRLPWRYRFLFLTASFLMSIVWIYVIANELVEVLATIGHIVGLSTSILGLTVLAWGNSIGDLFADVLLAKGGHAVMAAAGCWGGPTFNILIGLGSGLIQTTVTNYPNPFPFSYSATAPIAFYFLLGLIIFNFIILTCITKFHYRRIHGFVLIGIYAIFLILSILTESGVFPVFKLF